MGYLQLFKNRAFFLSLIGGIITFLGDEILTVALAFYALETTGSALQFAAVIAVDAVPAIILGPIAGAIIDKVGIKKIIIFFDILRGFLLLLIFFLSLSFGFSMFYVYVIVIVFGISSCFYGPASSALLPAIVEKDYLVQGNMIYSVVFQVSTLAAPALAYVLYEAYGIRSIIFLDAITFFVVTLFILFIRLRFISENNSESIGATIMDGFRLFGNKGILSISINGSLTYALVMPMFAVALPFMIIHFLGGNMGQVATLNTVQAIATMAGILLVPLVFRQKSTIKALHYTMMGMLAGVVILILVSEKSLVDYLQMSNIMNMVILIVSTFVFFMFFSTYGIFFSAFCQSYVEPQYLGRLYAILGMMLAVGRLLGSMIFGFFLEADMVLLCFILSVLGMFMKLILNYRMKESERPYAPLQDQAVSNM